MEAFSSWGQLASTWKWIEYGYLLDSGTRTKKEGGKKKGNLVGGGEFKKSPEEKLRCFFSA